MNSFGITVIYVGVILFATMLTIIFYAIPEYICISVRMESRLCVKGDDSPTATYDRFVAPNTSYDVSISFYLFNITDTKNLSSYKEVGPYVYNITRTKTMESPLGRSDSVTYQEKSVYLFNATASGNRSETDVLNVLDVPAVTLVALGELSGLPPYDAFSWPLHGTPSVLQDLIRDMDLSAEGCLSKYMQSSFHCQDYVCQASVQEILFTGMKSFSSCIISKVFIALLEYLVKQMSTVVNLHADPRPLEFSRDGKFAFYNQKNDSDADIFRVDAGIKNSSNLGAIQQFRGLSELNWFDLTEKVGNFYCDKINGTDGTIFPPYLDEMQDKNLSVFMPEVCRSFNLKLMIEDEDCKVQVVPETFGKPTNCYRYAIDESSFSTADAIRNTCYCKKMSLAENKDGQSQVWKDDPVCATDGVMPIAKCKNGAPLYISKPRFQSASQEELNDTFSHGFFVIEPHSGVLMSMHKKFQVNIGYPVEDGSPNSTKTILHPLLWYEEMVYLNPGREKFSEFELPNNIYYYIACGVIASAFIMIAGCIASFYKDPFEVSYSESQMHASDQYVGRPHVD